MENIYMLLSLVTGSEQFPRLLFPSRVYIQVENGFVISVYIEGCNAKLFIW